MFMQSMIVLPFFEKMYAPVTHSSVPPPQSSGMLSVHFLSFIVKTSPAVWFVYLHVPTQKSMGKVCAKEVKETSIKSRTRGNLLVVLMFFVFTILRYPN